MPAPGRLEGSARPHLVEVRVTFAAMGSAVTLAVRAAPGQEAEAREALAREMAWFREVHRRLSRFEADSELSRLNRHAGRWCVVSPVLFSALRAARAAWEATGGLFDPSVLPALERWGYDQDWRALRRGGGAPDGRHAPVPDGPGGAEGEVRRARGSQAPPFSLDPAIGAVRLEEGVRLDLGGIVKGLAADTSVRRLMRRFPAALVDAGGDIAAAARPGLPPWRIALPAGLGPGAGVVRVRRAGVATSATARRWWGPLGPAHHLIDPRTGRPAASGVTLVTVVAPSAAEAEVLAKAILIAGPQEAHRLLCRRPPAEARWRLASGEVGACRRRPSRCG